MTNKMMVRFFNTKSKLSGTAGLPKNTSSNTAKPIKVNLNLLRCQEKSLNLNAKIFTRETSNNEKTIVIKINTQSCWTKDPIEPERNGSDVINIELAGVFNPLKESCWVSSTLKIARRNAEQIAIKKATKGRYGLDEDASIILYMTNDGSNPKLTMSASESSSLPIGDDTLRN